MKEAKGRKTLQLDLRVRVGVLPARRILPRSGYDILVLISQLESR